MTDPGAPAARPAIARELEALVQKWRTWANELAEMPIGLSYSHALRLGTRACADQLEQALRAGADDRAPARPSTEHETPTVEGFLWKHPLEIVRHLQIAAATLDGPEETVETAAEMLHDCDRLTAAIRHLAAALDAAPASEKVQEMHTHGLERTSPKGGPFLGTCRYCGTENLPMQAALEPCAHAPAQEQQIIEALAPPGAVGTVPPSDWLIDMRELESLYTRDKLAAPMARQIERIFDKWLPVAGRTAASTAGGPLSQAASSTEARDSASSIRTVPPSAPASDTATKDDLSRVHDGDSSETSSPPRSPHRAKSER